MRIVGCSCWSPMASWRLLFKVTGTDLRDTATSLMGCEAPFAGLRPSDFRVLSEQNARCLSFSTGREPRYVNPVFTRFYPQTKERVGFIDSLRGGHLSPGCRRRTPKAARPRCSLSRELFVFPSHREVLEPAVSEAELG